MPLQPSEVAALDRLHRDMSRSSTDDAQLLAYYDTEHAFEHIGLALPPDYRRAYDVVTSGAQVVVDSVVDRQQVRQLLLPGQDVADPVLREIWDDSNMDAQLNMFNTDRRVYGRAFLSIATNELDGERPLIRAESPTEMAGVIDERHQVVTAAARFYGKDETTGRSPIFATLYLPETTVWAGWSTQARRWLEVDRDQHKLGAVPIFMHLNRRMTSSWRGRSAITRSVRSIIDGTCRNLTNMQFAIESHGIPRMWMTGVARGDFIGKDGKPLPQWAAYYNAIHTLTNPNAKIGQLAASDLKNFETAQLIYAREMSAATGFPASYFGITTTNPPAEGSIVGEEKRLVRTVERENTEVGTTLGWAMGLAYQIETGERVVGNRVRVDWHNPATPTVAQRMDAVVKAKQAGILSREGSWDELGWSSARKAKEQAYFAAEVSDPDMQVALGLLNGGAGGFAG